MDAVTTISRTAELTRADLDAMPDDGRRYELIDGVIIVSAAPVTRHQLVVMGLYRLLHDVRPRDLRVMLAPYDVVLGDSVVEPDLLVARRDAFTEKELPGPPLLAIEVLSPSNRWLDLRVKHERYQRAGCPFYWVLDPGTPERPVSIRAWELVDGAYQPVGGATGEQVWHTDRPFPVTFMPDRLLDD